MELKLIYEFITSRGVLSDSHRRDLEVKRGFTEQTIKRNRFFSGGQYLLALEKELTEQFKIEDLIQSGVFIVPKKSKVPVFNPAILDDRIIIPYLNREGVATLIRPHKLGLVGVPIQIYQPFNIIDKAADDVSSGTLIITEGEFKAAAAHQLGASCIALPGISSFSGEHYPALLAFLAEHAIKNVCIIFDNEVKDDPSFPNYKPDINDRFDTQYYAFVMAKMLNKDGFTTLIGSLPDQWRVNGKIDIDGAVSMGKTTADLDGVCRRALDPKNFYADLDDEAKEVIRKKEAKRYFRTHVRVEWGKYVAKRSNGKREWDEEISNFTLKIVATHDTYEGIVREIQIVNEFGKSKVFSAIRPEDMMGNDSFATFCAAHGNFVWKGRKEDLYAIWEHEFLNDSGRHIVEPDCIGWLPEDKIWVFGNVAFIGGKEMRPDDQGIFWTDKCGYKPVPLGVSSGKNVISEGIPYLSMHKCEFEALRGKLAESIGYFEATTCLGWAFSVLFMEDVFKHYGCFPFLFITGRRRSGKSTVAEWMMNLFGLENTGKQAADTTPVAVQRYMSYYSALPFFLDEYRNDAKVTIKNGLLRNAYNRQSAGKGMKSEFGIREAKVRGTIIIAGEETPNDNALLTRCIVVQVSELARKVNNFDWFTKNRGKLSSFAYSVLGNRGNTLDRYMSRLMEDKDEIANETKDDRLAINKAVVSAGAFMLFGEDKKYAQDFVQDLKDVKRDQEAESAVSMFFEDLKALSFDKSYHLDHYWDVSDGKIFLYFHGLYNIYARDYQGRHREAPFKAEAIRNYLKDEPGFVHSSYPHSLRDGRCKCVVFSENDAPDFVRNLCTVDSGTVPHAVQQAVQLQTNANA